MKKCLLLATLVLSLYIDNQLAAQQPNQTEDEALKHAHELLKFSPLIDGHNDLPWTIRINPEAPRDVAAYDLRKPTPGDTDLLRLRKGQVGAQFWSVYIPGEIKAQGFTKVQMEQIDIARRMIDSYPEALQLCLTFTDIKNSFKKGRIGSLLGMEGGHAIENSLGVLRVCYTLGVRYMTLTHNVTLDWVDAALDKHKHNGLTAFGKEVVREMNRLGMIVDLSHVTAKVMSDVLEISESPVIFSHSSARAMTDHPRNVPDSILTRLPENGGVVMVTFIPEFVSQEILDWGTLLKGRLSSVTSSVEQDRIRKEYAVENPRPKATITHVVDHIEHARKVAGIDHVAIGSDYYGGVDMPIGLEDTSRFPYLFAELIRRGWSDSDLKKLAGGNILRVMQENEKIAKQLQKTRPPSTATIEKLDGHIK